MSVAPVAEDDCGVWQKGPGLGLRTGQLRGGSTELETELWGHAHLLGVTRWTEARLCPWRVPCGDPSPFLKGLLQALEGGQGSQEEEIWELGRVPTL